MRKLIVMKSELLQVVENMKRFSSAMALMITSVCFWNMDLFPSTIHMLVFMSQKVGISFVLTTKIDEMSSPPQFGECSYLMF